MSDLKNYRVLAFTTVGVWVNVQAHNPVEARMAALKCRGIEYTSLEDPPQDGDAPVWFVDDECLSEPDEVTIVDTREI